MQICISFTVALTGNAKCNTRENAIPFMDKQSLMINYWMRYTIHSMESTNKKIFILCLALLCCSFDCSALWFHAILVLVSERDVSPAQVTMMYSRNPWVKSSCIKLPDYNCKLSHWGRVTHICVIKLTIIGSDNGLSPGRRQAVIWTNDGILLIGPLGTNFSEILLEIYKFSIKKMHLKMSSGNWQPFCFGLNVLNRLWFVWNVLLRLQGNGYIPTKLLILVGTVTLGLLAKCIVLNGMVLQFPAFNWNLT